MPEKPRGRIACIGGVSHLFQAKFCLGSRNGVSEKLWQGKGWKMGRGEGKGVPSSPSTAFARPIMGTPVMQVRGRTFTL